MTLQNVIIWYRQLAPLMTLQNVTICYRQLAPASQHSPEPETPPAPFSSLRDKTPAAVVCPFPKAAALTGGEKHKATVNSLNLGENEGSIQNLREKEERQTTNKEENGGPCGEQHR